MKNQDLLLFFFLLFTCFSALCQPPQPVIAGMSAERLERYSRYLEGEIEAGRLPGAVVLIARQGRVVHERAYGYSSLADEHPMRTDQLFSIMSMTKPIMSVAFMMLYEEGHFLLTDPLSKHLPQFSEPRVVPDPEAGADGETTPAGQEITIAQVLTHTAGFPGGGNEHQLAKDYSQALYGQQHETIADRVSAMAELPLLYHPGERWVYSASTDILAVLIEHFTGRPVAQFLQERLFDPLDMADTGYNLTEDQQQRLARFYVTNADGQLVESSRQIPATGNTVHGGAAGLFSTAGDYLKFCQMLLNGGRADGKQLLSPKTIELMTMNHVGDLYDWPGMGFGLGFGVTTDVAESRAPGSPGMYTWSGALNTHFIIDPEEELIAMILTQTRPYSNDMWYRLLQFSYQAVVD